LTLRLGFLLECLLLNEKYLTISARSKLLESYQQASERMQLDMLRTKNILEGYSLKEALNSNDYYKNNIRAGQTVLANWIRMKRFDFIMLSVDNPNGTCANYPNKIVRWNYNDEWNRNDEWYKTNGDIKLMGFSHGYNELAEPTIHDEYFVRLSNERNRSCYIDGYDHIKSLVTGRCFGSDEVRFFAHKLKIDLDKNPEQFATVVYHTAYNTFKPRIIGEKYYTEDQIRRWTEKITIRTFPWFNSSSRWNKEQKRVAKALRTSKKLLKEWLTPSEFRALMNNNLKIKSQIDDNITYIVRRESCQRVQIVKAGKNVGELCLICTDDIPEYDRLLNKILLLKTDEKRALEVANVWNR